MFDVDTTLTHSNFVKTSNTILERDMMVELCIILTLKAITSDHLSNGHSFSHTSLSAELEAKVLIICSFICANASRASLY